MILIMAALGVYKLIQIIDLLLTKEPMPWVKVVATTVLSYVSVAILQTDKIWLDGLVVATLAGIVHSIIRFFMYMGDMAEARSLR